MFIGRRPDGTIYGAWTVRQNNDVFHTGLEEVANDHPDYIAFRDRPRIIPPDPLVLQIAALEFRIAALENRP